MNILMPVETEAQYREALQRVSQFEGNEPSRDSPEGEEFEALLKLIDEYERQKHDPIDEAKPSLVIEQRLKHLNMTQRELSQKTGVPESRISEMINEKRPPSRRHIEVLSDFFNISADLLINSGDNSAAAE